MQTLRLELGGRGYPIHIGAGALDRAVLYAPHVAGRRVAMLTSAAVAALHAARLERALAAAGAVATLRIVVPDGEGAKCFAQLERVIGAMLEARLGRDTVLVALGGGVVGDLGGFAAAVYQRGIDFVQVPTTLLAQVDSSVGGKTAINHARGKNMIGAFHQPLAVVADVATLATLPPRELRAGIAEVIKHGVALDAVFAARLERELPRLLALDAAALAHAVLRSCELKADIVRRDERETLGLRALLNFGHTFGHAIEAGVGYGEWLHGEAVAAGMVMAAELSAREGMIGAAEVSRVRELVRRGELPVLGPRLAPGRYLELMSHDKKAAAGTLRFVLLESIGRAVLRGGIDEARVRAAIEACSPA